LADRRARSERSPSINSRCAGKVGKKIRELLTSLISSRNLSNEWKSSPQAPHDWLNSHRPTPTICNTSAGPDSDSTEETHLDGVVLNEYPADEDGDDGDDGVPEEMADTEAGDMDIDEGAVADEMDVDESATLLKRWTSTTAPKT
jgi:hypothetical protein